MYIDEEGYLVITKKETRYIEDQYGNIYGEREVELGEAKYKVNLETGLFEEVID